MDLALPPAHRIEQQAQAGEVQLALGTGLAVSDPHRRRRAPETAASTLAVAALFNPVRRRVQNVVDRRFNRARYDADKTIATFAAGLQDAVDLDSVRDDLAGAVHQALEPAHISVWISQHD
jgi:hypothetical protein